MTKRILSTSRSKRARPLAAFAGGLLAMSACSAARKTEPATAPAPANTSTGPTHGDPWLIENFEQPGGLSGGFWYEYDKNALGTVANPSPFELAKGGSPQSPRGAAHLWGTLGADRAPWTWVQLQIFLERDRRPVDVGSYKTLSFRVKGNGGRYSVALVRNAVKDYDQFSYEFSAPEAWTEVRVPLSEFHQAGWGAKLEPRFDDVTTIQFSPAAHEQPFDVWIDDIEVSTAVEPLKPVSYDTAGWFPWTGIDPVKRRGTALDVSRSLDAPAGKHGHVVRKGDRFAFADGKPARFWGVNIVGSANFPSHEDAERIAELLAELGVNMTRHHHMDAAWSTPNVFGNQPGTRALDATALERFDYFVNQLQKRGIYQFFDMLVHRKVTAADGVEHPELLAEGLKIEGEFAPRLIELQERFIDAFMGHKNPYTKRRYADDPAVALVDVINEDSLFWMQKSGPFAVKAPFYEALLNRQFSDWLKSKVPGGRAALVARWAASDGSGEGLRADEDPERGNVAASLPVTSDAPRLSQQRAEDTLRFLYETATAYYRRLQARLRKLGYRALVTGSNHWVEHPLDLFANSQLDFIDRHAYWAHPSGGWNYTTSISWNPSSMLKDPNLGLVGSLARRRVKGLPYSTSEWQSAAPNDYRVESVLLMGAYASFQDMNPLEFAFSHDANKRPDVPVALSSNFDVIEQPAMLAAWPAVSLLFHRADVRSATCEGYVKVERQSLYRPGASIDVPIGLPLSVKTGVDFNGGLSSGELEVMRNRFVKDGVTTACTGELRHDLRAGRFEVNTARSQGMVGFRPDASVGFSNAEIAIENPFALVLVTALDDAPITASRHVLVTAAGNAVNSGMTLTASRNRLADPGHAPVLVEPIRGKVTLVRLSGALDHLHAYALGPSGERTREVPLSVGAGSAALALSADARALHYELVRE